MPLQSNTNPPPGNDVDIEVYDDPGGGGVESHVVDVVISWNPEELEFLSAEEPNAPDFTDANIGWLCWSHRDTESASPNSVKHFTAKFQCVEGSTGGNVVTWVRCVDQHASLIPPHAVLNSVAIVCKPAGGRGFFK